VLHISKVYQTNHLVRIVLSYIYHVLQEHIYHLDVIHIFYFVYY